MKTSLIGQTKNIIALIIVSVLFVVAYIGAPGVFKAPVAESSSLDNVFGWAWSENIGWISANCVTDGTCGGLQNYGVNIDLTTGNLSGLAWSENIGYISFNRSETANPPSAPFNGGSGPIANYNSSTGAITGWARALSGCEVTAGVPATFCSGTAAGAASGGWDGWIKLSKDVSDTGPAYGLTLFSGTFGGFGWGSDVVGWIDFAPAMAGAGWRLQNPNWIITATAGANGTIAPTGAVSVVAGNNQTFTITPSGGYAVTSVLVDGVSVGAVATYTFNNVSTNHTITASFSFAINCGNGICATPETIANCPQDCTGGTQQF
mgnify:CR=1 FL=1